MGVGVGVGVAAHGEQLFEETQLASRQLLEIGSQISPQLVHSALMLQALLQLQAIGVGVGVAQGLMVALFV